MDWEDFQRHISRLSTKEQKKIRAAFDLGWKHHGEQMRKSGEPYFHHPIEVAAILADMGADADTVIAALLHDTLEDTDLSEQEIAATFGSKVLELVHGVTKLTKTHLRDLPTLDEQTETIRKMVTVMQEDVRTIIIKLADRLHNMQTIGALSEERQAALAKETLTVYAPIAKRLSMQELRWELEKLCLKVLEPDTLGKLVEIERHQQEATPPIIAALQRSLDERHAPCVQDVHYEQTSWTTLKTLLEQDVASSKVLPPIRLVIVAKDINCCYQVLGALHTNWQREKFSFDDYINTPQINGYRAIHTTIILNSGQRVQCRIRTPDMQEYAEKGIAVHCFDNERKGMGDYLTWTDRISPLTEDTRNRSEEFMQGLQNDILGGTILIHGPGAQTVYLPAGATALDAAFHLFDTSALRTLQLLVNGKEAPLPQPLQKGDMVDAIFANQQTVNRSWLQWVHTGFAMAGIRAAIAEVQPRTQRAKLGKDILQKLLHQHYKGYIEEFNEHDLQENIHALGLDSLEELYIAVADGRQSPLTAYQKIFEPSAAATQREHRKIYNIRYAFDAKNNASLSMINAVHQQYENQLSDVHYHITDTETTVRLRAEMSDREQHQLTADLQHAGAKYVRVSLISEAVIYTIAIIALIALWGLDPVFAKALLLPPFNVQPVDFTILRQVGFFLVSFIHLFSPWRSRNHDPQHRIPRFDWLLLLGGISFVLVALTSYFSLEYLLPQDYLTLAFASSALIPALTPFAFMQPNTRTMSLALVLVSIAFALLKAFRPDISFAELGIGVLVSVSFTMFTMSINLYKQRNRVAARYVQLLFFIAVISLLSCLPLLPFASLGSISGRTTLGLILYSMIMVGLPYHIYYHIISTPWVRYLSKFFFVSILCTSIAQYVLFHIIELTSLIPFVVIAIAAWLVSRQYVPIVVNDE